MEATITGSEVKHWLENALVREDLEDISVEVSKKCAQGEGVASDLLFVNVAGTTSGGEPRRYALVVKCGKASSRSLRGNMPFREMFLNEIFVYDQVLPTLTRFQQEKGIEDVFSSFPKCYGSFVTDDVEVIVLEDLSSKGYTMWNRMDPCPLSLLEMVVKEYGRFHAVSAALKDQNPLEYKKLAGGLRNIFELFRKRPGGAEGFQTAVNQSYVIVKDVLDKDQASKWQKLHLQVPYIRTKMQEEDCFQVISHMDCWNNNYMYKFKGPQNKIAEEMVILDWAYSKISSPILDLSHLILGSISGEDLGHVRDILEVYYESFSRHLKVLGSVPEEVYTFEQFLLDWKRYAKFGLMMASVSIKVCLTTKEEITNVTDNMKEGSDLIKYELADTTEYQKRIKDIALYAIENDLL